MSRIYVVLPMQTLRQRVAAGMRGTPSIRPALSLATCPLPHARHWSGRLPATASVIRGMRGGGPFRCWRRPAHRAGISACAISGTCACGAARLLSPRSNARLTSAPRAERCRSGRSGRSRKPLCVQAYRGFESHPLRHLPRNRVELSQNYRSASARPCPLMGVPAHRVGANAEPSSRDDAGRHRPALPGTAARIGRPPLTRHCGAWRSPAGDLPARRR